MTTWTATFTTDEDGEELMYRMEREFGIEFDEFHEVPDAPKAQREAQYDEFTFGNAILSVPNVKRDEIAVTGYVRVVAEADDLFGGAESKDYRSAMIQNPTWLVLTQILDEQMRVTKDRHHQFLEGVKVRAIADGEKIIELVLGS